MLAEAPLQVNAGGTSHVTDLMMRPRRAGAAGGPVQLGAGFIQTQRPPVGSAGGNAVMAGAGAFSATSSLPFPYKTNSWLVPMLAANNVSKAYLGPLSYNNKEPRTIYQLPVFPHPWAVFYNVTGVGQQGLLLTPERVRATQGANVPAPSGPGQNSKDQMAELQTTFDVATLQIDPGFLPHAVKVNRMGDYDAELVLQALDDRDFDARGLPTSAALTMSVVRGSPFLYFRAQGIPKVTLYNFYTNPGVTNTSGMIDVAGIDVAYTVITGPYPPNDRMLSTVLFYPAGAARYAPSTGIESTLAFDDPSIENYYVLCTLPDATFGDPATLTKLAEAAFSYPIDTTVTYAYDQATQTATATYRISTVNVLGGPVKSVSGLMPHHYEPISWHEGEAVLEAGPEPLQNGAQQTMEFLTIRGKLRVYDADSFTCRYPYPGILPWLPPLPASDQEGRAELHRWIYCAFVPQRSGEDPPYTAFKAGVGQDAYNLMKFLGRNVLAACSIADVEGDAALAGTILANTADAIAIYFRKTPTLVQAVNQGQAPYYVYYDPAVGTLNQYPSVAAAPGNPNFPSDTADPPYDGFGTLARCNDHHFHYGYLINAAAVVALRDPAWGAQWKDAINQAVFDVANDPSTNPAPVFAFPRYRNWDAYMNHGMAAGFNWDVVIGNNEESVSEHINFWSGVILWSAATGQPELTSQAVARYAAVVHSSWTYWFDPAGRNQQIIAELAGPSFPINWSGNGSPRLFDAYTRWDTFFGTHPAAGRGIMMFPLTPGAFYHAMGGTYINDVMAAYDAFVGPNGHDIDPLNPHGMTDWRTTENPWLLAARGTQGLVRI